MCACVYRLSTFVVVCVSARRARFILAASVRSTFRETAIVGSFVTGCGDRKIMADDEDAWYAVHEGSEDEGEDALGLVEQPKYLTKKDLKQEVVRVKELLLNLAMKKTLVFWQRLIRDDQLLEALPLKALRVACSTRGLPYQKKKRIEMITDIEKSILDEEEALRLEEMERIAQAQKELEASGSVYVCGDNSNGQLGLGDYHPRDELTVILALRGRKVCDLWSPLDSDLVFARTLDNQVLAWGWGQGAPFFGLKTKAVRDEKVLDLSKGPVGQDQVPGSALPVNGLDAVVQHLNEGLESLAESNDSNEEEEDSSDSSEGDGIGGGHLQSLVSRAQAVQKLQAKQNYEIRFNVPTFLEIFEGEAIDSVALGRTHAVAKSIAGDVYVWGFNGYYQLGLPNPGDDDPLHFPDGKRSEIHDPVINRSIKDSQIVAQVATSSQGTAFRLESGELLLCGHTHAKALRMEPEITLKLPGHGGYEYRINPDLAIPRQVPGLMRQFVTYVSCGMNHCAVITREGGLHTWGEGGGGRLGHGDNKTQNEPKRVMSMVNDIVLAVECSGWHTTCIVLVPPLTGRGGWVFTFGSGYKGQLGHGNECVAYKPKPIETFLENRKLILSISAGLNHTAAITSDKEVWTWGSNEGGALSRMESLDAMDLEEDAWTGIPGKVEGIYDWGKGDPAAVCCTRHSTIIALEPWEGPDEETWLEEKEMEMELKREEHERRKREKKERERRLREKEEMERVQTIKQLNRYHPVCTICSNAPPYNKCFGFWPDPIRPLQCGTCMHERAQHRNNRESDDADKWTHAAVMKQAAALEKIVEERDQKK